MQWYMELLKADHARQFEGRDMNWVEEIRLSVGYPLCIRSEHKTELLWPKLTQKDLEQTVNAACQQSVYAHTETLRKGFLTIDGGHRIGICGFGVLQDGEIHSIRAVSSIIIRVARQVIGCADRLVDKVLLSTLIIGPPGTGKTTLLRDLVRQLSDKRSQRIALVDERGELSASLFGVPQFDLGINTDVMINIPKSDAAIMMLRSTNPQWIAMDEITSAEDVRVMEEISYCGTHLLATAHAADHSDLLNRPLYKSMMERKIFRTLVLLHRDKSYDIREVVT